MHPEEKLMQLLREMLPAEACERVLPPLLAICRGETSRSSPELEHQHFHHPDPDPPYEWDE